MATKSKSSPSLPTGQREALHSAARVHTNTQAAEAARFALLEAQYPLWFFKFEDAQVYSLSTDQQVIDDLQKTAPNAFAQGLMTGIQALRIEVFSMLNSPSHI